MTGFRRLIGALLVVVLATIPSVVPLVEAGAAQAAGAVALKTIPLGKFDATGIFPTGTVTGQPIHVIYPAGYSVKLVNGGPDFVYFLSGSLEISDTAGTKTYHGGDFFWEPAGHIHTIRAITDTEIFVLAFLSPGARAATPLAPPTGPTNINRFPLSGFDATGLLPIGPATGTAQLTIIPDGATLKLLHGVPQFEYIISGTLQNTDETGTTTIHAGDFHLVRPNHIHTIRVVGRFKEFALRFVPPGITAVTRIVTALPQVVVSGPGLSGSFQVLFSSSSPGQGAVLFGSGPGCSGIVEVASNDLTTGTKSHTVVVTGNDMPGTVGDNGVLPGATYSFELVTVTRSGVETDDNGGQCYSVTIPGS